MNITSLIVELLQSGQKVELPEIGTFDSVECAPHHDPVTRIYYPATRIIVYNETTTGDESVVNVIAQRECVSADVARQMWRNYLDALKDKLQHAGEHRLEGLGSITKSGDKYDFCMAEGVIIDAGNGSETPLEEVKTYDHSNSDDPFAQFEAEPVVVEEKQSEPIPEPESEPTPAVVSEPEPVAEPEPAVEPESVPEPEPESEPVPETASVETVPSQTEILVEQLEQLEERPKSKSQLKAEAKAEKERELRRQLEERAAAKREAAAQKKERKKGRGLRWLLWILLVLLVAAAVVFLCMQRGQHRVATNEQPALNVTRTDRHLDVPVANALTFNPDLIEYSPYEIERNSDMVCVNMADYINAFLATHSYGTARVPMADRVRQYVEERMSTLLGPRFAIQRFIPYDDYVYSHAEPWMKRLYADAARHTVQGELMNINVLEEILHQVTDALNLEPAEQQFSAAEVQQVKEAERAAIDSKKQQDDDALPRVYVEKDSKQGFDIVAGFYLNKGTAAKMTARLHEQGCDAYIIEKNEMFYVSMGSAPTRTKAEALYNHIKSWYDGDIVIKQL